MKSRLIFAVYAEPLTPSEVARRLQLPANTVHYWTKKLESDGLLEQVETRGRSRVYRANQNSLEESHSVGRFAENLLRALSKLVRDGAERWELRGRGNQIQPPYVDVHELRLHPSDVPRLLEAVRAQLPTSSNRPEGNGEKMYTLVLVATPGRLSEES